MNNPNVSGERNRTEAIIQRARELIDGAMTLPRRPTGIGDLLTWSSLRHSGVAQTEEELIDNQVTAHVLRSVVRDNPVDIFDFRIIRTTMPGALPAINPWPKVATTVVFDRMYGKTSGIARFYTTEDYVTFNPDHKSKLDLDAQNVTAEEAVDYLMYLVNNRPEPPTLPDNFPFR